jgi:hypothetical protein
MINNANDPSRNMIFSRIIEYGLLGLLIFAPLPAASVYEWSILVIQLAVLVMLAAYILMVHKPRIDGSLRLALKWPKFLFLGFLIFAVIQVPGQDFFARRLCLSTAQHGRVLQAPLFELLAHPVVHLPEIPGGFDLFYHRVPCFEDRDQAASVHQNLFSPDRRGCFRGLLRDVRALQQ